MGPFLSAAHGSKRKSFSSLRPHRVWYPRGAKALHFRDWQSRTSPKVQSHARHSAGRVVMRSLFVVFSLVASAIPALAEVGPPVDVASRARGAGKVVVARIIDVRAQFETNRFGDQLIVSHAVLEVLETLKGAPEATMTVAVEGGTVGDITLKVSDLPSVNEGDRAVFFLDAGNNSHTPHDRGRGIMKLNANDRVDGTTLSLDDVRQQVRGAASQGRGGR